MDEKNLLGEPAVYADAEQAARQAPDDDTDFLAAGKSTAQLSEAETLDMRFAAPREYNVAMLGAAGAGQTALCERLARGRFVPTARTQQVGSFTVALPERNIQLHLFDLVGMRDQAALLTTGLIVRHCHVAVVSFQLGAPAWKQQVYNWVMLVRSLSRRCQIVVVGTKLDLVFRPGRAAVEEAFAHMGQVAKIVFCSAKTGQHVDEVFDLRFPREYEFSRIELPEDDVCCFQLKGCFRCCAD